MPNHNSVMIIGAGPLQVPAILEAKAMGLDVLVIDANPEAPGIELADRYAIVSTLDIPAAIAVAKETSICGVFTLATDAPVKTVAAIGNELGLNAISVETSIVATNKALMRQRLAKCGVAIPWFFEISDYNTFLNAMLTRTGKATIIKPVDNSGSRGVLLITDSSDLQYSYNYALRQSRSGIVVIEDFMEGPEVSVESLTVGGVTNIIAITDKLTTGAPYFVEIGHSVPSQLPTSTREAITGLTKRAIKALDINSGPAHTEIIITKDGPKIVEIGARLGGGYITTHLVPLATGVNLVEDSIKVALGEPPRINRWFKTLGSAIRYLTPRQGRVLSINGVERAKDIPGVVEVQISFKIGDIINPIIDCSSRVGYVISKADTPDRACKICEEALATITIEVE